MGLLYIISICLDVSSSPILYQSIQENYKLKNSYAEYVENFIKHEKGKSMNNKYRMIISRHRHRTKPQQSHNRKHPRSREREAQFGMISTHDIKQTRLKKQVLIL